MPNSLTSSLSQAGLNAVGSYHWTTDVLLLGGQRGHFTGHEHQLGPSSEECGGRIPSSPSVWAKLAELSLKKQNNYHLLSAYYVPGTLLNAYMH